MAKNLVLISHGTFCEELKNSTEMIMGPQENISTVALLPSEGPEDFKDKLLSAIDGLEDYVVLADLMGGTPCNAASRLLMKGYDFPLYAGMNMPMVIGFLNGFLIGEEVDLQQYGRDNIHNVNALLAAAAEDDEDE